MTDFYFHEKVKSIQNLPISCLVEEGLRSLPAKRILVKQVFNDFERRNGIDILRPRKSYLQCLQWWPGVFHGDCSLSTTEVCFSFLVEPSKVLTQALHVVRELLDTLYLFLKVVFHDGTNKVFPNLFLPESVQFSARKLSSVK